MAGSSQKMHANDEVLYELLQENEYRDTSESRCSSDSEINVKISSCGEHSVSSDEEKMSVTTVAFSMPYRQSQVTSDHVFHLLASVS
jgi:hypothetical protein